MFFSSIYFMKHLPLPKGVGFGQLSAHKLHVGWRGMALDYVVFYYLGIIHSTNLVVGGCIYSSTRGRRGGGGKNAAM